MAEVNMNMTVYEFNQNIMKQLPVIEEKDLQVVMDKIEDYCEDAPFQHYLMLLCKERSDYTLFNFAGGHHTLSDDIIECFKNRDMGIVHVETVNDKTAMEIWVKKPGQMEEAFMYYLFPADNMVITYKEEL